MSYQISYETLNGGASFPVTHKNADISLSALFLEFLNNTYPEKTEISYSKTFLDALDVLEEINKKTNKDHNILRFQIDQMDGSESKVILSKQYVWVAASRPKSATEIPEIIGLVVKIIHTLNNEK